MLEANPRASRTVPFVAKATGVPLVEHACRLLLGEPLAALDLPERAEPTRAWAKEAIFPSDRFAGAAVARPGDALDRRGDGERRDARRGVRACAARGRPVAPRRAHRPAAAEGLVGAHVEQALVADAEVVRDLVQHDVADLLAQHVGSAP